MRSSLAGPPQASRELKPLARNELHVGRARAPEDVSREMAALNQRMRG